MQVSVAPILLSFDSKVAAVREHALMVLDRQPELHGPLAAQLGAAVGRAQAALALPDLDGRKLLPASTEA
jgi:hypothetical protein